MTLAITMCWQTCYHSVHAPFATTVSWQTRRWCAHLNAMEQAARERRTTAGDESSSSWRSVHSTAAKAARLGCALTAASRSSTSCLRTGTAGSVCSSVTSGRNSCNPMHCDYGTSHMSSGFFHRMISLDSPGWVGHASVSRSCL